LVALPICFLCTVAILVATGFGLHAAAVALFPALSAYTEHPGITEPDLPPPLPPVSFSPEQPPPPPPSPPTPEEIARAKAEALRRRQDAYVEALFQARRAAVETLVGCGCVLVVAWTGLLVHLRALRQALADPAPGRGS
jgi:hypothetical protein